MIKYYKIVLIVLLISPITGHSQECDSSDKSCYDFIEMLDNAPEGPELKLENILLPNGLTAGEFMCEIDPERFMKENPELDCAKYIKVAPVKKITNLGCKNISCKKVNIYNETKDSSTYFRQRR